MNQHERVAEIVLGAIGGYDRDDVRAIASILSREYGDVRAKALEEAARLVDGCAIKRASWAEGDETGLVILNNTALAIRALKEADDE